MNPQQAPLLTRHGVRNLNGPKMDGRNHNGRAASCPHHKSPDLPTYPLERMMSVKTDAGVVEKLVRCHMCATCGELRFTDQED